MSADDSIIRKVQALIAKAESTTFEAEAEALYAKANELMLRHAIDQQQLAAASGKRSKVVQRVIVYSTNDANLPGKKLILHHVAENNRCRVVFYGGSKKEQRAAIVGFEDDTEFVEMLFTSLMLQASRDGGRAFNASSSSNSRKVFMTQFLLGFGVRIGERMEENRRIAEGHTPGAALVLVERRAEVDDAFGEMFPNVRKGKGVALRGDIEARMGGHDAGSRADISGGRNTVVGQRAINK